MRRFLFGALALLALGSSSARASIITVSTDQTGANTQIDTAASATFNFTVLTNQSVSQVTGNFTIKDGPQTSLPIVLSLYNGSNASGSLISSVSVAASSVTQTYTATLFNIMNLNLLAGNYSLTLTSTTPSNGANQYFFKNGNLVITPDTVAIPTPPPVPPPGAAVPEPSTVASLGLAGLIGLAARFRRNRRLLAIG